MPLDDAYLQDAEARLAQLSPPLLDAFRDARAVLPAALTDDQQRLWVEEGLALAAHSIRSWEAGADYFRVAPAPPPGRRGAPPRRAPLQGHLEVDLPRRRLLHPQPPPPPAPLPQRPRPPRPRPRRHLRPLRRPRRPLPRGRAPPPPPPSPPRQTPPPRRARRLARRRRRRPRPDPRGRRGLLPSRVRQSRGDHPGPLRPRRPRPRRRAPPPLRQSPHRRQHLRPARRRPRREGHRLGQRARPLHRRLR